MQISVSYSFLPKQTSIHAAMVMDHFGIGFDAGQHVIADRLELPVEPSDVILFTGPSGSGKSSLLKAVAEQLSAAAPQNHQSSTVLNIDALDLGEKILVDGLHLPAEETFALLTSCGLGEARLMLRSPAELSDGQRYRYRLALALAQNPDWMVADEFTATLDRTLAKVIAFNLGKTARRRQTGVLLATTHDDVADDLQPDLHVRCGLDGQVDITRRSVKKNESALLETSRLRPAKNQTGRTLLGGITAATNSGWSAG